MVKKTKTKDSKSRQSRPPETEDPPPHRPVPLPRKKNATLPYAAGTTREDRLMMRMHVELVELLNKRSAEAGESRSRFIEKILVGYLKSDPRNPRIDPWGRIDPTAPPPLSARNDAIKFGERWSSWKELNVRLGLPPPPDEWVESDVGYNMWAARANPTDPNKEGIGE